MVIKTIGNSHLRNCWWGRNQQSWPNKERSEAGEWEEGWLTSPPQAFPKRWLGSPRLAVMRVSLHLFEPVEPQKSCQNLELCLGSVNVGRSSETLHQWNTKFLGRQKKDVEKENTQPFSLYYSTFNKHSGVLADWGWQWQEAEVYSAALEFLVSKYD